VYAKKERVLGEEKGRTNLGGRESVEIYHKYKKADLIYLYL